MLYRYERERGRECYSFWSFFSCGCSSSCVFDALGFVCQSQNSNFHHVSLIDPCMLYAIFSVPCPCSLNTIRHSSIPDCRQAGVIRHYSSLLYPARRPDSLPMAGRRVAVCSYFSFTLQIQPIISLMDRIIKNRGLKLYYTHFQLTLL